MAFGKIHPGFPLKLITILVLLLAVPVTVLVSQRQQNLQQEAANVKVPPNFNLTPTPMIGSSTPTPPNRAPTLRPTSYPTIGKKPSTYPTKKPQKTPTPHMQKTPTQMPKTPTPRPF